ncbi:unnamed protein product [Durusdinium trenchii]|uniref:PilZ domain-containing protein n=1 Tax=Durusdinium trenchii TaxID=1381693 RepID=A0ABP0R0Y1_9DINO
MMVLRHGMEVSAIKHGKVESWALCRKDFGKEVVMNIPVKDSFVFNFARIQDVSAGGAQVLALVADETKTRIHGFLYGSRMALLTQEVAEQVFSPPSIPGVPDNPAMMCMYGQQFDMQATYLFVCADQTKTPTDESLLETMRPGKMESLSND